MKTVTTGLLFVVEGWLGYCLGWKAGIIIVCDRAGRAIVCRGGLAELLFVVEGWQGYC